MRLRSSVVVVTLLAAVGFGWLMLWAPSEPSAPAVADHATGGAESEPVEPARLPPASPTPPAPTPPSARVDEQVAQDPTAEDEPIVRDDRIPDHDRGELPELPPHLVDAPASKQRRYYEQLLAHQEAMLGDARDRLGRLEGSDRPAAERLRAVVAESEAKTAQLREHLASD